MQADYGHYMGPKLGVFRQTGEIWALISFPWNRDDFTGVFLGILENNKSMEGLTSNNISSRAKHIRRLRS